ncbi:hypothetical protein HYH03_001006 [Edaphochlamys debaryana]|uniref:Uncharacterized protein n=1 Tax=Edaphochlamys debaryana TaxID=47281 RepID=A0A836C6Y0_9CHLO|nr:hypothetical protein HYH03_001006 [Edaphochlamys debaryana]|eukprot:KAG2501192.1 hypothetical protein HYH03_001006 [Edaphochlamys debaryana]
MLLQTHDGKKGLTLRQGWQHMVAEGSVKSFFKGNGANVVKIAPETALKLTLNDSIRSLVAADPDRVKVRERMASGGIAGAIAQGLLYPLDTIRTRLAVSPPNTYAGILHAAYRIRRDEGLAAFYRGLTPSMIGILPFAGVDIALFEVFKEIMYEKYDGRPPHMGIVVAGMMSSSIAQVVSYPLALVRTRLQAQTVCRPRAHAAPAALHKRGHNHSHGPLSHAHSHPHTHHVPAPHGHALPTPHHTAPPEPASSASHAQHTQQPKYRGMVDVFRKTIEYEGVRGLYKGLLPNLLKMAPAAGIGWYIFEETKFALGVDPRS